MAIQFEKAIFAIICALVLEVFAQMAIPNMTPQSDQIYELSDRATPTALLSLTEVLSVPQISHGILSATNYRQPLAILETQTAKASLSNDILDLTEYLTKFLSKRRLWGRRPNA